MTTRLIAPPGCSSAAHEGVSYKVKNGIMEVESPSAVRAFCEPIHGFRVAPPVTTVPEIDTTAPDEDDEEDEPPQFDPSKVKRGDIKGLKRPQLEALLTFKKVAIPDGASVTLLRELCREALLEE